MRKTTVMRKTTTYGFNREKIEYFDKNGNRQKVVNMHNQKLDGIQITHYGGCTNVSIFNKGILVKFLLYRGSDDDQVEPYTEEKIEDDYDSSPITASKPKTLRDDPVFGKLF